MVYVCINAFKWLRYICKYKWYNIKYICISINGIYIYMYVCGTCTPIDLNDIYTPIDLIGIYTPIDLKSMASVVCADVE